MSDKDNNNKNFFNLYDCTQACDTSEAPGNNLKVLLSFPLRSGRMPVGSKGVFSWVAAGAASPQTTRPLGWQTIRNLASGRSQCEAPRRMGGGREPVGSAGMPGTDPTSSFQEWRTGPCGRRRQFVLHSHYRLVLWVAASVLVILVLFIVIVRYRPRRPLLHVVVLSPHLLKLLVLRRSLLICNLLEFFRRHCRFRRLCCG